MVLRSAIPVGRVWAWMWRWGGGVAGLAGSGDLLTFGKMLTVVDGDAALAEVAEYQVVAAADVDHHVVSGGVLASIDPIGRSGGPSAT